MAGGLLLLHATPAAAARADAPLVRVENPTLNARDQVAVVTARVRWNATAIDRFDMIVGDVRLLAIDRDTDLPRRLAARSSDKLRQKPVQSVRFKLTSAADLHAIRPGNRVVLTASQHGRSPDPDLKTPRTYVTVAELQKGPPRRFGTRDCGDEPIVPQADLTSCDLVGASLARAQVGRSGARTELMKADLTGADLRNADLSDVDLAAGRVNGANATHATIDGVSMAKADGVGFIAHDTTISSSDLFDANLARARFGQATFEGTSLGHSRFDHADLAGASILGANMDFARFVDANLRRATLIGDTMYFADFTDARLLDASMDASPEALMWTLLCRTELPDGTIVNRDCTGKPAGHRRHRDSPRLVTVDATLDRGSSRATITGRVRWNVDAVDDYDMRVGEVRAVAVSARDGTATILGEASGSISRAHSSDPIKFGITRSKLAAIERGNRVVVTATQHPSHPDPPAAGDETTERSYVAVDQLQAGPDRGRVGSSDCSDRAIAPGAAPGALRMCDLVGAALADADLSSLDLRMSDLTAADLRVADLSSAVLDGSRLADGRASGARFDSASLKDVTAQELTVRSTLISSANFFASALRGASFKGSTLFTTELATAGLGGHASFEGAQLDRVDLAYANLGDGDLTRARAQKTSLFLSDLTDANLRNSSWSRDEEGRDPPRSAILCHTTLEEGEVSNRDCVGGGSRRAATLAFLPHPSHQPRHHYLRARADHQAVALQVHDQLLERPAPVLKTPAKPVAVRPSCSLAGVATQREWNCSEHQ